MVRVLIPTQKRDVHSFAVQRTLQTLGHDCVRLFGSDFPTKQVSSLRFENGRSTKWDISGPDLSELHQPFDTIWRRRLRHPFVPAGTLTDEDMWVSASESRMYFNSLWQVISPGAVWVNADEAARRASSKGLQLFHAQEIGMSVPPTLLSNDPEAVRSFVREHEGAGVVYKMFFAAGWVEGGKEAVVTTTKITSADLPSDHAIRCVPGIYQGYINKAYELRVTFMGGHYVALKLHTQQSDAAKTDWRYTSMDKYKTELSDISPGLYRNCREIMRRLGIVFAAFDFIVTPEGEEVFLELNEAGQFLFVEKEHPDAALLQAFSEFLVSPTADFHPKFGGPQVSFRDLFDDPKFHEEFEAADSPHLNEPLPWHKDELFKRPA